MGTCSLATRYHVALMTLTGAVISYMMRTNISVNIIAMVTPKITNSSSMRSECVAGSIENTSRIYTHRDFLKQSITFDWTEKEQGYILSSYFYGYAATCLIGGSIAERFGPRMVVFISTFMCAVATLASPFAAKISYLALMGVRLLAGIASGCLFPTFHVLVARWAPPAEKGRFISTHVGASLGTALTWNLMGPIIEAFGWDYAFYIPGAIAMVWCFVWLYLVHDSPVTHPRISEAEKKYIIHAIGDKVEQTKCIKVIPPYKSILTSSPVLALVLLQYGNIWGTYFIMTAGPKYVSSALGFNLVSTGTLASLPNLAKFFFSIVFGFIGDRLMKGNIVSVKFMRNFFCIFSHLIPGALLLSLGYIGCSPYLSLALITFSLGLSGSTVLTSMMNAHDLAPNFAGTIYGIVNGIANTSGFITPMVTAHFLKDGNTFEQWRPVFMIGASMYIFTAFWFLIFGSTDMMPWNYIAKKDTENYEENCKETIVTLKK